MTKVPGCRDSYGVHEVFYDDKGKISSWTGEPDIVGESEDEVVHILEMMLRDVKRVKGRVLDFDMEPETKEEMM